MAVIRREDNKKCNEDVEKWRLLYTAGGSNMYSHLDFNKNSKSQSADIYIYIPVKLSFHEKVNIFLVALVTHRIIMSDYNFLNKYFFKLKNF